MTLRTFAEPAGIVTVAADARARGLLHVLKPLTSTSAVTKTMLVPVIVGAGL